MKKFLAIVLAVATFSVPAIAADIFVANNGGKNGVSSVIVSGRIEMSDGDKFIAVTRKLRSTVVILKSDGGNVFGGITIANHIRAKGWFTAVPAGVTCSSVCADIWLAGSTRFAGETASIGMHSAGRIVDGEFVRSAVGNTVRVALYLSIGLKAETIDTILTPDPTEMLWLTPSVAAELGIRYTKLN